MKFISKLLISLVVCGASTTAICVSEMNKNNANDNTIYNDNSEGNYVVTRGDYTLSINRETLYFEVTKGQEVFKSYELSTVEDGLTGLRRAFITSPLTVYFMTANGGENYFSIFDSAHEMSTRVTFNELSDGCRAHLRLLDGLTSNPSLSVELDLVIRLVDEGISIGIENVVENESTNKLSKIIMYPAFNSSYGLVDGYYLIPDGSGALIDLSVPTNARSAIQLRTYDSDIGVLANNRTSTTSEIYSLPMFASNVGNKSMIATISGGEEFSELNSKVASINDNYNYTYYRFDYRDYYYRYQGISEDTRRPVPQENINEFNPSITYYLYDEDLEYYEIAQKYQEILVNSGKLTSVNELESTLRLEFLMSENKPSLFGKEVIAMSDIEFIKEVVEEFNSDNKNNLSVSLFGYSKGGLTSSYPNVFPTEGKTGSDREYEELGEYLSELNIDYSFLVDFIRSYEDSGIGSHDLAMNMSEKYIQSHDYHPGSEVLFNHLTLSKTEDVYNSSLEYINRFNASGIDFTSIGTSLYSSHNNEEFTRTEAKNFYHDLLSDLDKEISMRKPNLYMYDTFDNYLEMKVESSGFLIETESIPFVQMVLSGYKNMYSEAINLNYTGETQLLKLIDFNVNPTFLVTKESAMELYGSSSSYIFSSTYSDWKEDIDHAYSLVVDSLSAVNGAKFISREEVLTNVYLNSYSNGKALLINYNGGEISYNGVSVSGYGCEVIDV